MDFRHNAGRFLQNLRLLMKERDKVKIIHFSFDYFFMAITPIHHPVKLNNILSLRFINSII